MTEITINGKSLFVSSLSQSELEVVHAASQIFNRVFSVSSIIPRLKTSFSDTGIYNAIRALEDKGVFFVDKESNKQLSIRFTEKGRTICRLVKERINTNKNEDFTQATLF